MSIDSPPRDRESDPVAALVAAIQARDSASVSQLIERHPELRSRLNDPLPGLSFGATALLAAVSSGDRNLVTVLLDAGADIHQKSRWWAGGFGVLDDDHGLADFLIERGANVDAMAAARLGMTERLELLIAADPGVVHQRGGDGQTPLHVAASPEIAALLLDHGADIEPPGQCAPRADCALRGNRRRECRYPSSTRP